MSTFKLAAVLNVNSTEYVQLTIPADSVNNALILAEHWLLHRNGLIEPTSFITEMRAVNDVDIIEGPIVMQDMGPPEDTE